MLPSACAPLTRQWSFIGITKAPSQDLVAMCATYAEKMVLEGIVGEVSPLTWMISAISRL